MVKGIVITCVTTISAFGADAAASEQSEEACSYRQAAISVPAIQVSSAEVGHPWRTMYGYCLLGDNRLLLHQDWVMSYLDAEAVGDIPGGNGVGLGSDLLLRWHPTWRSSLLPSLEVGGGIQFAAGHSFPADGSRWMFILHAGAGWLIPLRRDRQASLSLRYLHISNAGLADNNSGYDVLHVVLGVQWVRGR